MNRNFWRGRRVFVTGHTGFKGSWLSHWLGMLGADVTGYSLNDATGHDVRDLQSLCTVMSAAQPDVVLHLAAQALVRPSYDDPVTTFTTNVIGTVQVLEAIRTVPSVRVAVMVTSDKCYANNDEVDHPFREEDPLGGRDPYSGSKACAELAIAAYRHSAFDAAEAPRIVSVRAGNVIGGGDWSKDRLVPDLVRAFRHRTPARIRFPDATRPWQFVLDALHGYLTVAEHAAERAELPHSFNFGPHEREARTVRWLANAMVARWGDGASWCEPLDTDPYEARLLALDSTRARTVLGWRPLLDIDAAVEWTTDWYKSDCDRTAEQIERYMERLSA